MSQISIVLLLLIFDVCMYDVFRYKKAHYLMVSHHLCQG